MARTAGLPLSFPRPERQVSWLRLQLSAEAQAAHLTACRSTSALAATALGILFARPLRRASCSELEK